MKTQFNEDHLWIWTITLDFISVHERNMMEVCKMIHHLMINKRYLVVDQKMQKMMRNKKVANLEEVKSLKMIKSIKMGHEAILLTNLKKLVFVECNSYVIGDFLMNIGENVLSQLCIDFYQYCIDNISLKVANMLRRAKVISMIDCHGKFASMVIFAIYMGYEKTEDQIKRLFWNGRFKSIHCDILVEHSNAAKINNLKFVDSRYHEVGNKGYVMCDDNDIDYNTKSLLLFHYNINDFIGLDKMRSLKRLELYMCRIHEEMLLDFSLVELEELILNKCNGLKGLGFVGGAKQLVVLQILECEEISDEEFRHISSIGSSLKELSIVNCENLYKIRRLGVGRSLSGLKVLDLCGKVGARGNLDWSEWGGKNRLENLIVRNRTFGVGQWAEMIGGLNSDYLRSLDVSSTKMEEACMDNLLGLRIFIARNCKWINGSFLEKMSEICVDLRILTICSCELVNNVKYVLGFSKLEILRMNNIAFRARNFEKLNQMHKLYKFDLGPISIYCNEAESKLKGVLVV